MWFIEGQWGEDASVGTAPGSSGATPGEMDISAARHRRRRPASSRAVTGMPLPDLRTLDGLRAYLPLTDGTATPAARAFMELDSALAAHAAALRHLDRAEVRFIAARRGVGADQLAKAIDAPHAADAAHGAAERLGLFINTTALDRLRHRGRGSRRRSFIVRQARERRLAERGQEAADCLHHAPVEAWGDTALKLAAVIAAGEAGPPDATAFPWSALRHLLADVVGLTCPVG